MKRWHLWWEGLALEGVTRLALRSPVLGGSQLLAHVKAAAPPRGRPPQKGLLRDRGHLSSGAPASTRRGANADAEGAAPRTPRGPTRTPRGAGVAGRPPGDAEGRGGGSGSRGRRVPRTARTADAGAALPGARTAAGAGGAQQGRGRPCRDRRRCRRGWGGREGGRRRLGEEGKGSGPVEPDALTTGAGAAAEERIAIGGGGERPPPFSRAPGPGAIAIAARSGSGVGGSGPGVVLTTGSGLKGGRGVGRWLRGS